MKMKLSQIALFLLSITCCSAFADSVPSVAPANSLSPAVQQDAANWACLMWAVYCSAHPKKIRQSRTVYDTLIAEFEKPSEKISFGVQAKSFICTQRATLRLNHLQDIRGAKADCEWAVELNPENVRATWLLSRVLEQLAIAAIRTGKQTETGTDLQTELMTTLKRVIELDADHAGAHETLARFAKYFGETELAITSLKALTRILPFEAQFHLQLSELYEDAGRLPESINSYERVVTIQPRNASAKNHLGQLYLQVEDFENAVTAFQAVLEFVASQEGGSQRERTRRNERLQRPNRVTQEDTSQIELDAQFGIGIAYQGTGEFVKAEGHLLQAIVLTTEKVKKTRNRAARNDLQHRLREVQYTLAQGYLRFEEKAGAQKALTIFAEILAAAPEHVGANYGSGIANQVLGNTTEAEVYLSKAIELSSTPLPDAYNALGYLYAQQGIKLDEAESLVEQALRSTPTSGAYLDSLGFIYFKQGQLDAAIETLEKADRHLPNTPDILLHLGDAYLRKRWTVKARQVFQRALELSPENTQLRQKLDSIE